MKTFLFGLNCLFVVLAWMLLPLDIALNGKGKLYRRALRNFDCIREWKFLKNWEDDETETSKKEDVVPTNL